MNAIIRQQINTILSDPEKILLKEPFTREIEDKSNHKSICHPSSVGLACRVTASLPRIRRYTVSQETFMKELDVFSHGVLYDENVPSITIKTRKNGFLEIEQYRMAVPFQMLIMQKQVRHLCVNNMSHTLLNTEPTDQQTRDFMRIKQAWDEKNMEGAKTKFVQSQKSYGDAGLLFFIDSDNKMRTRVINFADGYVIITHKNNEGRHILECLYYSVTDNDGNTTEYLDCYDDEYMTQFTNTTDAGGTMNKSGWVQHEPIRHGFSECPLITKRGEVAWDRGQKTIESYEALYNTFIVIQKRHGWGALYVKGKFNQNAKKIAGSIVLNDTSLDPNADAKYLNPPDPQNMIETLELMEQTIMKSCGTTFILPKDIKISGDTSGLAVEMTQELDMATAQDGVIEWQNVANKMMRLFKEGLAMELVNNHVKGYEDAKTRFAELRIQTSFMVWKPKSEEAHNQMLATLHSSGGISQQTYIEKNTISTPDELMRIRKEHEEQIKEQEEQERKAAEIAQKTSEQTIVSE